MASEPVRAVATSVKFVLTSAASAGVLATKVVGTVYVPEPFLAKFKLPEVQ
jgi:hypothetical protein